MLTPEAAPWAKTGGLADVLGALPPALVRHGVDVTVILPGYRVALATARRTEVVTRVWAPVSSRTVAVDVLRVVDAAVPTFLLAAPEYFDRDGLYGTRDGDYPDNGERYVVFARAALEWLRTWPVPPDLLHVHDWQAAIALPLLRGSIDLYPELRATRSICTVHNLAYQGRFWAADWHLLNLDPRWFTSDWLEFWGDVDFLKGGLVFADAITTVSPRYALEIQTPAFGEGLDGVLRARADRLYGILNGADYAVWDPLHDRHLAAPYGPADLRGKDRCRRALQTHVGLVPETTPPILGVIARFAAQKGMDLVLDALPPLLAASAVQVVVLGDGDPAIERGFDDLRDAFPGRVALHLGFDDALAHRIQGGADLFLMPSRYEPCGLAQMYALRYATIPVVRATGGLDDTVVAFDAATGAGTGFKFADASAEALRRAVLRALAVRRDARPWTQLRRNAMAADFSWDRSARSYAALYAAVRTMPAWLPDVPS